MPHSATFLSRNLPSSGPLLGLFLKMGYLLLTIEKVQSSDDRPILLPKTTVDVVQITKSSMFSSRLLLFFEKHKVNLHVFHHFPSFSQQFTSPFHAPPFRSRPAAAPWSTCTGAWRSSGTTWRRSPCSGIRRRCR
jgi:hypothetical protein